MMSPDRISLPLLTLAVALLLSAPAGLRAQDAPGPRHSANATPPPALLPPTDEAADDLTEEPPLRFSIGVGLTGELGRVKAIIPTNGDYLNPSPGFGHTRGIGGHIELNGENLVMDRLGYTARLALLSTTAEIASGCGCLTTVGNDTAASTSDYRARLTTVELQLLARYELPMGLTLSLGPAFGLQSLGNEYLQTRLVAPDNVRLDVTETTSGRFSDDARSVTFDREPILAGTRPTVAALIRAGWPIRLTRRIAMAPELELRMQLTNPVAGYEWAMYSGMAGITLTYALGALPDTPPNMPPAAPAPPASIDLHSELGDGTPIEYLPIQPAVLRELRTIELPSFIPFEHDGARILETIADAELERGDDLRLDPAGACGMILPLVADRLKRESGLTIALTGSTGPGESESLAGLRAAGLRDHLVKRLGCPPERVIVAGASGSGPGVEIVMSPDAGMLRVSGLAISRSLRPAPLRIVPRAGSLDDSDGAVRHWSIDIRQGDRLLARRHDGDTEATDLAMLLGDREMSDLDTPIDATFLVEGSAGWRATARDTLPIRMEQSTDTTDAVSYTLIPSSTTGADDEIVRSLASLAPSMAGARKITLRTLTTHGAATSREGLERYAKQLRALLPAGAPVETSPGAAYPRMLTESSPFASMIDQGVYVMVIPGSKP